MADEKKNTDRKKALESAILQIEKQFGKGAIMKYGEGAALKNIEVIPTGCLALDIALGIGGIPKGRIIEIYGPESSGKTTVSLHIIAELQKQGGIAAFIDAEHALDPVYAANLGVDLDNLYVSQPDNGEQALDIADYLVDSGAVDLIVVDSVAALTPKAEIEGDMGDSHVGLQARLMSQALRKLAALKFYASVRLDVRKADTLKDGAEIVGNRTKVKVVKNKLAPPFKTAEFDIVYGKGISQSGCILDLAVAANIVEKSGSWFAYNGEKIGQGRDNAKNYLSANPAVMEEIKNKLLAQIEDKKGKAESENPEG